MTGSPAGPTLRVFRDGTPEAAARLERVLTNDPGLGVVRHADAGYEEAIECAERLGLPLPGRSRRA